MYYLHFYSDLNTFGLKAYQVWMNFKTRKLSSRKENTKDKYITEKDQEFADSIDRLERD